MPPINLPKRNLSWKVLEQCNYRCSYCLQQSYGYHTRYMNDISGTVEKINQCLNQEYEIKIAGGEIFINPSKAIELANEISKYGHWMSLCTNFSATLQDYYKFIEATEGRLYKFAVSLHTEYVDYREFFEKCKMLKTHLPKDSKLQVHNVIPRGVEDIVKLGKMKEMFDSENMLFYTDLLVDDKGKYIVYTNEEMEAINTYLGEEERLFINTGKVCRAGESYFVLLPNLDAWTCWEAWYADDKTYYLGNMMNGTFAFRDKKTVCPFETCSCPTPVFKDR